MLVALALYILGVLTAHPYFAYLLGEVVVDTETGHDMALVDRKIHTAAVILWPIAALLNLLWNLFDILVKENNNNDR